MYSMSNIGTEPHQINEVQNWGFPERLYNFWSTLSEYLNPFEYIYTMGYR